MSSILESNVILQSYVHGPLGKGFQNIGRSLDKLEKRLNTMSAKEYKIKFILDDAGLRQARLKVADLAIPADS